MGLYICNSLHILNYSGTHKIRYFRSECLSLPSPQQVVFGSLSIPAARIWQVGRALQLAEEGDKTCSFTKLLRLQKRSVHLMAEFGRWNYERQNTTCASNYLLIKDMQLTRLTSDIL